MCEMSAFFVKKAQMGTIEQDFLLSLRDFNIRHSLIFSKPINKNIMKQYKLLNNIFGWVAFLIAAFTYLSTVEPTASFWDCPEFITTKCTLW